MSNIYLLERGGANAAKYFANIRTLLVETNLSEEELGRARITDNHKHIKILDERTSHVHFTKLDKERMEVVRKMLDQHADKDITLFNGGRWCMEALLNHGSQADIDRAIDRGLDKDTFKEIASSWLASSARSGDHQSVEHLLPHSDATASNSSALRAAAFHGHLKCLELLLPHSDPRADDSWALRAAARNGHLKCVEALLPHSDVEKGDAITVAVVNGHIEVANTIKAYSEKWDLTQELAKDLSIEQPQQRKARRM